jgi:putative IMPACT (imprinted ancient) family translation regulator
MLQRLNVVDVVVVVTRWYGGVQLGADRFKHITNVAQELVKAYVDSLEGKTEKKGKKN